MATFTGPQMEKLQAQINEAQLLYNSAVKHEQDDTSINDVQKLIMCHGICTALLEHHDLPWKFRAKAYIYLSAGRNDDTCVTFLKQAIWACDKMQIHTGEYLPERSYFEEILAKKVQAMPFRVHPSFEVTAVRPEQDTGNRPESLKIPANENADCLPRSLGNGLAGLNICKCTNFEDPDSEDADDEGGVAI